jgi:hypothetical protein
MRSSLHNNQIMARTELTPKIMFADVVLYKVR